MPLFMDVHNLDGAVALSDVAKAHAADLQDQADYDVSYLRYWVDEGQGKIFCLVEAPAADAAATVHREAHGLVADEIFPSPKASDALSSAVSRPASGAGRDGRSRRRPAGWFACARECSRTARAADAAPPRP